MFAESAVFLIILLIGFTATITRRARTGALAQKRVARSKGGL